MIKVESSCRSKASTDQKRPDALRAWTSVSELGESVAIEPGLFHRLERFAVGFLGRRQERSGGYRAAGVGSTKLIHEGQESMVAHGSAELCKNQVLPCPRRCRTTRPI